MKLDYKLDNKWILLAGGPNSGKTTLLNYFSECGYACKEEQARFVLDEFMKEGIPFTAIVDDVIVGSRFQDEIVKRELARAACFDKQVPTFFDRSTLDYLAITKERGLIRNPKLTHAAMAQRFALAFVLETIDETFGGNKIESAFTNPVELAKRQTDGIATVLDEQHIPYIHVPVLPLAERAEFILANCRLRGPQI